MIRSIRPRAHCVVFSAVVSLFTFAGCASDSNGNGNANAGSGGGDSGGAAGSSSGSAAAGGLLGGFAVRLVAADPVLGSSAYTSFSGTVYDGVLPTSVVWSSEGASGDCELLVPRAPFCDPACGSGTVCTDDDVCIPMASTVDVGSVRLSGAGATDVTVVAGTNNYYQAGVDVILPYPPAAEGAPLGLDATGGSFGDFSIESEAIAPLELAIADPLPVEPDQPLRLTWTPGAGDRARILVELDVSNHGGTKGKITCETADTGSLEIAASLVTDLLALGLAGFPTIDVSRRASGTARVSRGEVELLVVNDVKRNVSIPGLVSCNQTSECPMGQTCEDLRCR